MMDCRIAPTSPYERVRGTLNGGKHVYKWFPVGGDGGNLCLGMEVATGSEVSGIRDGTATVVILLMVTNRKKLLSSVIGSVASAIAEATLVIRQVMHTAKDSKELREMLGWTISPQPCKYEVTFILVLHRKVSH